ncbi:expressed unknown protein [Seminavis robusta]|uniref:Uncharacterized protein n=1 Tax=Seminavis robusta TaxID=568900 RepID=A0A9N8HLW9_9STRA|nr:expressed unknown protein [Seminavis robusta]|eukprot:Sro1064_g237200.1 n/a (89) ;mRNA; r:1528-1794
MNPASMKPTRGYVVTSFKPTNFGNENQPPTKNNSHERSPKSPSDPKDSPFAKKPRKNAPLQAALSEHLGMEEVSKPGVAFLSPNEADW